MKRILFSIGKSQESVMLQEEGVLTEYYVEPKQSKKIVGNIYKGKVSNLLAGMQAAFVNVGLEKNAFLYVGDTMADETELSEPVNKPTQLKIKVGDDIMVQVVKDEIGGKGARATNHISIPGRLIVMMPTVDYLGISRKILDEEVRANLASIVNKLRTPGVGYIIRTAAASATKEEIEQDIKFLKKEWESIKKAYQKAQPKTCIFKEANLVHRTLRDVNISEVNEIVTNDKKLFETLKEYQEENRINKNTKVILDEVVDLAYKYNITEEIINLASKNVRMENGSYLVFDKTEALTVIDVNTGKYVGDSNLEETVYNTNLAAAREIAKQLRLRNIGGIVIVDFIDMNEDIHKAMLIEELRNELKKDRTKTTVMGMTGLGLVEITRKKSRNEIASIMTKTCPYCKGDGYIITPFYTCSKIKLEIRRRLDTDKAPMIFIKVNPEMLSYLKTEKFFSDLKNDVTDIYFEADETKHVEEYEISLEGNEKTAYKAF